MPQASLNQKTQAFALLGKPVRFVHQQQGGEVYRILSVNWEGMVTLNSLPGEFAPSLFVAVEDRP